MKFTALVLAVAVCGRADELKPSGIRPQSWGALRGWLKTQATTALVVSVGGRILFEYGDIGSASVIASARKAVLGMLYGKYVIDGTINLQKGVKELGLEDLQKFLPREEHATLEMLLMSRSGIYLPEGEPDPDPTDRCSGKCQ